MATEGSLHKLQDLVNSAAQDVDVLYGTLVERTAPLYLHTNMPS